MGGPRPAHSEKPQNYRLATSFGIRVLPSKDSEWFLKGLVPKFSPEDHQRVGGNRANEEGWSKKRGLADESQAYEMFQWSVFPGHARPA